MKSILNSLKIGIRYLFGHGAASKLKKTQANDSAHLVFKTQKDGTTACVGCKVCERVCPANALSVSVSRRGNMWQLKSFHINQARCDCCALCVEACPVDVLVIDKTPLPAATDLKQTQFHFENAIFDANKTETDK